MGGVSGSFTQTKLGLTALTQFNSAQAMTISNSNLAFMSSRPPSSAMPLNATALVRTCDGHGHGLHPGSDDDDPAETPGLSLFLYGNTISNSTVGVEVHSDHGTADPSNSQEPTNIVLLNNTFYKNGVGLSAVGTPHQRRRPQHSCHVPGDEQHLRQLDDGGHPIAENSINGSQAQYNLFWQNTDGDLNIERPVPNGFLNNIGAIIGDPRFRRPG